jgi:hypothetical protein
MTAAVAQGLAPGATAAVVPKWGAALLAKDVLAACPPSGRVAPLDGKKEGAGQHRPVSTSLQVRPQRLGAGPSDEGHDEQPGKGVGPPAGDSEEAGGTKVPHLAASVARGDVDATVLRGEEEPQRGSARCTLSAPRECDERWMDELRIPLHEEGQDHRGGHRTSCWSDSVAKSAQAGEAWTRTNVMNVTSGERGPTAADARGRDCPRDVMLTDIESGPIRRCRVSPLGQRAQHQSGVKRGCDSRRQ